MDGRETPAAKTIRLGMEAKLKDYNNAGDMTTVNALLDHYPKNTERAEISLEQAHEIAKKGLEATVLEFRRAV